VCSSVFDDRQMKGRGERTMDLKQPPTFYEIVDPVSPFLKYAQAHETYDRGCCRDVRYFSDHC
jgi:hypothetical protein